MCIMVRKVVGVKITDVEWDQMVDEQPQNSLVIDSFSGSALTGADGATGRVASLTNTLGTMIYVALGRQLLMPSEYSVTGVSLTINVNVDDTSRVSVAYLKSV